MEVIIINEKIGKDFVKELERIYGSMDKLKKLVEKDPAHPLYNLDLNDWIHLEANPYDLVETNQSFHIDDFEYELPEVDEIVEKNPLIQFHFPYIEREDLLKTELEYQIVSGSVLIKFEEGQRTLKPVISFKNIGIKIV
jgi:hypothetical protein